MHERQESAHLNEVNVQSLSDLTGFPVDFIKKELLIDSSEMTMDELRASVLEYLDQTFNQLN